MNQLRSVCVYCGSSMGAKDVYRQAAETLGRELVSRGLRLVYGAGSVGLMGVLARTVHERGGEVLGIIPAQAAGGAANAERESGLIRLLIELRAQARARKDFAQADTIRDQAKALGVVLEDGKEGTSWKLA